MLFVTQLPFHVGRESVTMGFWGTGILSSHSYSLPKLHASAHGKKNIFFIISRTKQKCFNGFNNIFKGSDPIV